MNLPEVLNVTLLERGRNLPVEGLAVILRLLATRKNMGPAISNLSGQVRFQRDECERSVIADQQMFVMIM
jgi:hypothetical protein